jgi:hypothetical protein
MPPVARQSLTYSMRTTPPGRLRPTAVLEMLKTQLITLKLLTPKGASMKYCGLSADCGGRIYSPMPSGPSPIRPVPVSPMLML